MDFFLNNYFSKNQFEFIKGRSTALQLLHIMDEWTTQLRLWGRGGKLMTYTPTLQKCLTRFLIAGW